MRTHLLLLTLLVGCADDPPPPPPDVLVITLDTTRADVLGAWGASPSPSPTLDELAADSIRFTEAQSVTPLTLPAHASILTGLYPDRHGVRSNDGFRLDESHTTLAERFADAGYTTAGFVAAAVLDDSFGLAQGFDHYGDSREAIDAPREVASRPGQAVADELSTWLLRAGDDPVFTWAHFYDPHLPLDPPEPHASAWEDAYLGEVAAMDAAVGQVLDAFALMRTDRPRIVLVVGDHGEGRGDHGEATHGIFVYRSTMHVPMLLSAPGLTPSEVAAPVSQVDIAPTLLALAGQPVPEDVDGVDLGPLWRGEVADRGLVYGESLHGRLSFGLAELAFAQDPTHRYIRAPRDELYAWTADPDEQRDAGDVPKRKALASALATHMARDGTVGLGPPEAPGAVEAGALEALGYLEGIAVDDTPWAERPDPKDARDLPRLTEAVLTRAHAVAPAVAVPMLEAFVEAHPGVVAVRLRLSVARELTGELDAARAVLEPLLGEDADPRVVIRHAELGLLAEDPDALAAVEALITAHPEWNLPVAVLAEHLRVRGKPTEARTRIEAATVAWSDDPSLQLIRAAAALDEGDPALALAALEVVAEEQPAHPDGLRLRARAQAQLGQLDEALATLDARLTTDPEDVEARGLRGLVHFSRGHASDATTDLARAVEAGSTEVEVLLALADLRAKSGDVPAAEALVAHAETIEPGSDQVRAVRAAILLQQGRFAEAEALQREP